MASINNLAFENYIKESNAMPERFNTVKAHKGNHALRDAYSSVQYCRPLFIPLMQLG
jgi:hypothetical protein